MLKKELIILQAIVLAFFCSCSKWDGDFITQEFSVNGIYTELEVEDAFDVTVSDEVSLISITAGDRIMSKVKVEMNDNKLKIYLKEWTICYGTMKVTLPYNPDLVKVDLSGSSSFHSLFPMKGQKVDLELSGASDFFGSVEVDKLKLDMSGSSNATIDGVVRILDMDISGSSDLVQKIVGNHYTLVCDQCKCSMSGSSNAYIHCNNSISGSLSGSSTLYYTGNAATSNCSTSGGSSIIHDIL